MKPKRKRPPLNLNASLTKQLPAKAGGVHIKDKVRIRVIRPVPSPVSFGHQNDAPDIFYHSFSQFAREQQLHSTSLFDMSHNFLGARLDGAEVKT